MTTTTGIFEWMAGSMDQTLQTFISVTSSQVIDDFSLTVTLCGTLYLTMMGFMMITGFWTPLMLTVYLVTGCTILAILIGWGTFIAYPTSHVALISAVATTACTLVAFIWRFFLWKRRHS